MHQRRMISAGLWSQRAFARLPYLARLLWLALITQPDDQSRLQADPAYARSVCFPLEDVPLADVAAGLRALSERGWLILYQADGEA